MTEWVKRVVLALVFFGGLVCVQEYRESIEARGSYLARYEGFTAEALAEGLVCRDCAVERVSFGDALKRVRL